MKLLNRLHQFIAIWRMPDGVVRDRYGGYWMHISQYEIIGGVDYPFNYCRMSVSWYGAWEKENSWLSKHTPIINCI